MIILFRNYILFSSYMPKEKNMEKQRSAENAPNRFFEVFWPVVFFIVALIVGGLLLRKYFASQEEKAFRSRASALVIASENLMTLADEGVDNGEFMKQLDEVRARYNAAGEWPLNFTAANYEYVQALQGWSLASEVWNTKVEQNSEYAFQDSVDLDALSTYLGIGRSKIQFFTASDMVRQLLYSAGEHARTGKGLVGY